MHVTAALADLAPSDWPESLGAGVLKRVARGSDPISLDVSGQVSDKEGPFASSLLIPVQGDPTFVLALFRRGAAFSTDEVPRHASLATLLGDLHDESRARLRAITELERMQERLRAIEDLRPALTGAHDSVGLLTAAAEAIAERFGAQATSVMLIEPNGEMRIAASVGLEPQVAKEARRRVGEGISGWVAERGRGVLLRGPIEDARFRGVDPEARVALSVPLRLGSAVLGVVNVKRPREGTTFDESHLRALEAIASDVATALKQVEQLQGLEEDRRRAVAIAEIARLVQSGDRRTAARLACEALGYAGVGIETRGGLEVLYVQPDVSLGGEHDARFETPAGTVVFVPGPDTKEGSATIAEGVAPLLAGGPGAAVPEPRGDRPAPSRAREHIRVFVLDDHPIVREGLRRVLELDGDIGVCGAAQTLSEALLALPEARPGVIVCDLHLPDADDVEAVRRLSGRGIPLIVFSIDTSPDVVFSALKAGARGYIPKRSSPEELRAAVRAVASGITAVDPDVFSALQPQADLESAEPASTRRDAPPPSKDALTPRELEYLRYLAEGYTNKEIARTMVLAEDTVKKGIQGLIAKMGAADRTHAVVLAMRHDLID
ncbi:MAG: response regulator [Chloroflexi bacterium]|nr:MAG: response regulator [Chloroflexota bacterium]